MQVPFGMGGLPPELGDPELPAELEPPDELDELELLPDVPDEVEGAGVLEVVVFVVEPASA